MQGWMSECGKKVNNTKREEYNCECCVKIWNDLDKRLAVAWDNKIEKLEIIYM